MMPATNDIQKRGSSSPSSQTDLAFRLCGDSPDCRLGFLLPVLP
jgi:hypothetical protein